MGIEKYVLALRCLNAAIALDSSNPRLHAQIVAFAKVLKSASSLSPKVVQVLQAEFKVLDVAATDLSKYNAEFEAKHKASIRHILSSVAAQRIIDENKGTTDEKLIAALSLPSTTFPDAIDVLDVLKNWSSSVAEVFQKEAHARFPQVTRLA